ncbi:unnamed protein product [Cyclocybe aegerita]|uniref:Uncharacterized protein n=1 Tax=Cyclocybe aegerita TaxID=1973307 RepID=A0A8S0WIW7_CYCAE|nr:unnamed protein product [Cyclocybe aegerita]
MHALIGGDTHFEDLLEDFILEGGFFGRLGVYIPPVSSDDAFQTAQILALIRAAQARANRRLHERAPCPSAVYPRSSSARSSPTSTGTSRTPEHPPALGTFLHHIFAISLGSRTIHARTLEEEEIWKAMKASMPTGGGEDLMDDSGSEDDDDDDDEDEDDDLAEDEDAEEKEDSDADDLMSLVEGSDNEDLISLDGDVPEGLIEYDGPDDSDDGDDPGVLVPDVDRKHEEAMTGGKGGKRKKLRSLPTFATYEDYAKLIEEGPEDDI